MGIADRSERSPKNLKDMQEFTLIFRVPTCLLGMTSSFYTIGGKLFFKLYLIFGTNAILKCQVP